MAKRNNPLKEKIIHLIEENGPLSIDQYMDLCLYDPLRGYYKTKQVFGRQGDFITAPEVSQMFGEMLAIWLVLAWQKLDKPSEYILCEMGPGRGTLMRDIVHSLKIIAPEFLDKSAIKLIETSPALRQKQQELLKPYNLSVEFLTEFDQLGKKPLFFIANELLDALPIRQFVKRSGAYFERKINFDKQTKAFFFQIDARENTKKIYKSLCDIEHKSTKHEDAMSQGEIILEDSPSQAHLIAQISHHIHHYKGAGLLIDYGSYNSAFGDTLQALGAHQYCSVLENPGYYDITAHVDFFSLAQIAKEHCSVYAMEQGDFLLELGLLARAGKLGYQKPPSIQEQIQKDVERLVSPEYMGNLFKIFCLTAHKEILPPFTLVNKL